MQTASDERKISLNLDQLALLDAESVGYFCIDADGFLCQFNATAGRILGVTQSQDNSERHVSSFDRFLGLGLASEFASILSGTNEFQRSNITCTNRDGHYMTLNCQCTFDRGSEQPCAVGIIREVDGTSSRESFGSDELEILSHVANALSSSHDLNSILRTILIAATASQGLGFNRAFLLLHDSGRATLDGYLAVGPESAEDAENIWRQLDQQEISLNDLLNTDGDQSSRSDKYLSEKLKQTRVSLSASQTLQSLQHDEQWAIVDIELTEDQHLRELFHQLGCHHAAIVPLRSPEGLEGVLIADNLYSRNPICEDAVRMLQILANQAAIVLKQTRLIDDLKARADQLILANRRLSESQDQLIQIEKLSVIGELTSAVAHELRNPLTVIGGFANLMLNSNCNPSQQEYLQIISSEIKRTEQVLDQVLDFSKASEGKRTYADFNDLVENSLSLLIGRLARRDLELPLKCAKNELPISVNCDQVSHALFNIFKLVAEELTPPFVASIVTEAINDMASLRISFSAGPNEREKLIESLQRMFSERANSQRLSILVAGETIRLHGGDVTVGNGSHDTPSIVIQIPLFDKGISND